MKKDTPITGKYHHITKDDRDIIAVRLAQDRSDTDIAAEIGKHRTTIWRERTRNRPQIRDVRYLANRAHDRAMQRQKTAHERERLDNKRLRAHVTTRIKKGYSPEQVAGDLAILKPELKTNHESIYQYIYSEARELLPHLRKHRQNRRKRGSGKNKRVGKVQNRTMISERPSVVSENKEYGHWESDTMVSRQSKAALQICYERKMMYVKLKKLEAKTAEEMRKGITKGFCRMPKMMLKTMTMDNGTENAQHLMISSILGIDIYFCNPYHSWEKGGVENIIGLIREYLPKGMDLSKLSSREVKQIERRLNNRPRKRLGYLTPAKVFRQVVALAA